MGTGDVGVAFIVRDWLKTTKQGKVIVYVMLYTPGVLTPRLITPVLVFKNTRPAGIDVKVPPGKTIVGVGFGSL
jgi:hypothetical protein